MNRFLVACLACSVVAGPLPLASTPAEACTRCLKVFADGTVVVGRSMDWVEDPGSELWVFPRRMKRQDMYSIGVGADIAWQQEA
jgi:choloylglycine hydrolase